MRIHNTISNVSIVNVGSANISNLRAGSISAGSLQIDEDGSVKQTATFYTPIVTIPVETLVNLNTAPGLPIATSGSTIARLPEGANVVGVRYKGENITGAQFFNLAVSENLPLCSRGTSTIAQSGAGGVLQLATGNTNGEPPNIPGSVVQVTSVTNVQLYIVDSPGVGEASDDMTSGSITVEVDYYV